MHDPGGQARQAVQGGRIVQVAHKRGDAAASKQGHSLGARGEPEQPHPSRLRPGHAQADITASDDQEALTPEAGRQGAKGALV